MRIVLLSPIYPPYRGGGAQYIPWLQRTIAERMPGTLHVVTETHPEAPRREQIDGAVLHRTLVSVANYNGPTSIKLFRYAAQNFQYLGLLRHIIAAQPRIFWFHGALFIRPSVLTWLVRFLKFVNGQRIKLVLDLRDPNIPNRRLSRLAFFDQILSCCGRIDQKLMKCGFASTAVHTIPIACPQPENISAELPKNLRQLGLEQSEYLLMPHGVRDDKNFPLVFAIWRRLRALGYRYKMVVAGPVVNWNPIYREEMEEGNLVIIGEVCNAEVRAMMKKAVLVFSIGRMEGLPRTVLEAIEAGTLVALPPGVPEFQDEDRELVIDLTDSNAGAKQVANIIENKLRPKYDTARHTEERVKKQYAALFERLAFDDE